MPADLSDPKVVRIFGSNLDICLQRIGSKPESLALRCGTNPQLLSGFKQGLGILSKELLLAVCADIGISKELMLQKYQSPSEAIRQFETELRNKRKITASSLIGTNKTEGDEPMAPQLQLPAGKLNEPTFRENFGQNVNTCLRHLGKTSESLAIHADMSKDSIERLLFGKLSLSNDDVEAIRAVIGLPINDLIMDYIDDGRRNDELLAKLKAAGRIKPPQPVVEVEPEPEAPPATTVLPMITEEEPAIKPVLPTATTLAESQKTMELPIMTDGQEVTWKDDDVTGTTGSHTFNLRNKDLRKQIAQHIRALKNRLYPDDTFPELFARIKKTNKNPGWLNNLGIGSATITGTDIEIFAEFFKVSVLSLLTGKFENAEVATIDHDISWSADGTIGTDLLSGRVFDLSDGQLSREVARRVRLLSPTETTVGQMLDEACIDETTDWFETVQNGTRNFAEEHIEAFAEFLNVTEFALLSGEGLDLPEKPAGAADSTEEVIAVMPESTTSQPEAIASVEEAPSSDDTADSHDAEGTEPGQLMLNLGEDVQRSVAFQEHFKQRLLSTDFQLADSVSPRSFLAATQAATVDWCSVYYTMTKDGVETLKQVATIAERFDAGDSTLNMDIFTHVLSLALRRQ